MNAVREWGQRAQIGSYDSRSGPRVSLEKRLRIQIKQEENGTQSVLNSIVVQLQEIYSIRISFHIHRRSGRWNGSFRRTTMARILRSRL
jgi:hypothetical protein